MGHITVAAVAKSELYRAWTQVCVVTDGLKIGGTQKEAEDHLDRQRHEREWLTHNRIVVSMLGKKEIRMNNWLEDLVPCELIDRILVLDRGEIVERRLVPSHIAECGFSCRSQFCDKFHVRLIASQVRKALAAVRGIAKMAPALNELLVSPDSSDPLSRLDEVSYVVAEKAIRRELVDPLAVTHEMSDVWKAIKKKAEEGLGKNVEDAVSGFNNEFRIASASGTIRRLLN